MEHLAQSPMLKPATTEFLSALNAAKFFCRVGKPCGNISAIHVSSWFSAMRRCGQPEWRDAQVDMGNEISERLNALSKERFDERFSNWNVTVRQVRPHVDQIMRQKLGLLKLTRLF